MAATGKTPILLYGSTTATNTPSAGNLTNSSDGCEIAINVADKNLFFKDSSNVVNTVPIRQSSASSNGWLSSTDWSTFNSKQPAGTYVTSVTGTAPVVSSGGTTPAISMAAATGSVNGYLTSTDWTTFNNKANSFTYTNTYIPYGQGTTTPAQSANFTFNGSAFAVTGTTTLTGSLGATTTASFSPTITATQTATAGGICSIKAVSSGASTELVSGGSSYAANYMGTSEGGVMMQGSSNTYAMRFNIYNSTAPYFRWTYGATEVAKIDASGNLTVSTGNLVIGTSGKGIDFSATAGTGTSELLADYEEGSFTPTLTPSTSGSITLNGTYTNLTYTKVGRIVTVSGLMYVNSVSSPVGTSITLGSLPYATVNSYGGTGSAGISYYSGSYASKLLNYGQNATTASILMDASTVAAGNQFQVTFVYHTA